MWVLFGLIGVLFIIGHIGIVPTIAIGFFVFVLVATLDWGSNAARPKGR